MTLNIASLNEVSRAFGRRAEGFRHFSTPATEQVDQSLRVGLAAESDSVLVLVGSAGAGKTRLIQSLLDDLPAPWSHKARLNFTLMSAPEMLRSVAYAFGMPPVEMRAPTDWLRDRLCAWQARGHHSVLVVDEAQSLSLDALGTLLGLSQMRLNHRPLMRIILVGRPELLDLLDAPEVAPFALHLLSLPGLRPAESMAYVRECLTRHDGPRLPSLSSAALAEIHRRTQGLPGRINPLCIRLFHTAILRESFEIIGPAMVVAEADELAFHSAPEWRTPVLARIARYPEPVIVEPLQIVQPVAPAAVAAPAKPRRRLPVVLLASLCVGLSVGGALLTAARWPRPSATPARQAHAPIPDATPLVIQPAAGPAPVTEAIAIAKVTAPAAKPVVNPGGSPVQVQDDATHKLCEKLLVQVSLGEPLSVAQNHILETQCH